VVFNVKAQSLKILIFRIFYENIKYFSRIIEAHLTYKQFVSYWKFRNYLILIKFIE